MHIRCRQTKMDTLKLRTDLVGAAHRSDKTNNAVLPYIAAFHGEFTRVNRPSFAANLGLGAGVARNVRIVSRSGTDTSRWMPEGYRSEGVRFFVDTKFIGIQRIGGRVAVLPNLVWIVLQRKVSRCVE